MRIDLDRITLTLGERRILDEASLTIEAGDYIVIHGPSGSGKTSILRLFNRLADPTSGAIRVDGQPMVDFPATRLRRRVAYLQQSPVTVEGSVRDNLLLGFLYRSSGSRNTPDDEALRRWLADFLLDGLDLNEDAATLSIGQKQRVSLIRILLGEPEVLLCDEPTSALDPDSRDVVDAYLERINVEHGITVILVTHLEERLRRVTPRRFVLRDAQLIEDTA